MACTRARALATRAGRVAGLRRRGVGRTSGLLQDATCYIVVLHTPSLWRRRGDRGPPTRFRTRPSRQALFTSENDKLDYVSRVLINKGK